MLKHSDNIENGNVFRILTPIPTLHTETSMALPHQMLMIKGYMRQDALLIFDMIVSTAL